MNFEKRHRLLGLVASFGGTTLIFLVVIGMNEFARREQYDNQQRVTSFEISPPVKQPEPQAEPEPQPEAEPVEAPAPPPLADLASDIGSVDIPIPGFDDGELDRAAGEANAGRDLVMTDETVDTPPRAKVQMPMQYPATAKRNGVKGHVTVSLLIDDKGSVQQVRVLESEPAGVFDEAAVASLRQWEFEPAAYKGESVRVWARQTVRFALQ